MSIGAKQTMELIAAVLLGSFLGSRLPNPSPLLLGVTIAGAWAIWSFLRPLYGARSFATRQHIGFALALSVAVMAYFVMRNLLEFHFALAGGAAAGCLVIAYYVVVRSGIASRLGDQAAD